MKIEYVIKTIDYLGSDYKQIVTLRDKILRKPLGLSFSEKDLAIDKDETIIGLFVNYLCVGCVQMRQVSKNEVKLRQMAVDNSFQGKGLGIKILQYAEGIALSKHYKIISLHARKTAVGFYKNLGFSVVGNTFLEVGIPHFLMQKKLD